MFDRINLDPKIQIRYIDTKHQLADILTKGNFTRDEWNNLLHLFNISHFSLTSCYQNDGEEDARTKRRQDCGKIKAHSNEPDIHCLDKFSIREPSDCVENPGILKASSGKPDARARRNSKPDAASSSQGRLKGAYLGGLMVEVAAKPAATDKSHESWEFSDSESWSSHQKEVTGKLVASRNSGKFRELQSWMQKMAT